jgi:hypothetical protein
MPESNRKLVGKLMRHHNVPQLRELARSAGVTRQRGDSKRQTAWRIVKQNREAASKAVEGKK